MSKDALTMMFPAIAMVVYIFIHFTLWRQQGNKS